MKFLLDYIILILSVFGCIASIWAICSQDMATEAITAIIILGCLLSLSMLHDWWYAYRFRRKEQYVNLYSELNAANAQIRNKSFSTVQEGSNLLMTYCESISTIFTTLKGHRIGVCIKLFAEDNGEMLVLTQARDSFSRAHNRKTGNDDKTRHLVEANSDFNFIYKNMDNDIKDSTFYFCNNLVNEVEYRNCRLINWEIKKIAFIPNFIIRRFTWPLSYKATIVVPIIPLISDYNTFGKLRGFLCIDSKKSNVFDKYIDIELLKGIAAELCPIVDHINKLVP